MCRRIAVCIVAWIICGDAFYRCLGQASTLVPADRRVDWTHVGIPGGIPNRTIIYATFSAGASVAAVQNAVDNCPPGQVIFLGPGVYNWTTPLLLNKSGVTIRGAGPNATIISHSVSGYNGGITVQSGNISGNGRIVPLRSGYTKGSTNLVLAAPDSSLRAGFQVTIDQENDGVFVNNNGVGGFRTDTTPEGDGLRSLNQLVEIKSISNGTNIVIWPPLYWTYSANLQPQVYYRPSNSPTNNHVTWSGVENLCLSNRNASGWACLLMNRTAYCWAKNIKTVNASVNHVLLWRAYRNEIRHSEFNGAIDTTSGNGYGIEVEYQSCANLIEDNIVANNRDFVKVGSGGAGNVIAYNYHVNCIPNSDVPRFSPHAGGHHSAHPMMNLWEGNAGFKWVADFYWGSVSHSTLLRNWFRGSAATPYAAQSGAAMVIDENLTSFNILGNILGCTALATNRNWTTKYATRISPQTHGYEYVYATYRIGYYSDGDTGGGRSGADEWASHIVAGNYDYVTGAQDWYNPTAPQTIPNSFYYTSKPAYFGSLQWPPFNPANPLSATETAIPAGYRYVHGVDPPGGPAVNQPPVAFASATPRSGAAPLTVNFSSAGSYDPEGTALTYNWTLGDGTVSTAANPSHTFANTGNYTARLTVSDGTNSVSSSPVSITVAAVGSGLVASYSFDEDSGQTVSDVSGNNNSGSIIGATWVRPGKYGSALAFDGASRVAVGDSNSLDLRDQMTLEAWVYPTNALISWRTILIKERPGGFAYAIYGGSPAGRPNGLMYIAADQGVYGPSTLPQNTWSHLAATYDGSVFRLYVNGNEVANAPVSGEIIQSDSGLSIGGNTIWGEYFQGMIDEVRIYNRALSASEIQDDMDSPLLPRPDPPRNLRVTVR